MLSRAQSLVFIGLLIFTSSSFAETNAQIVSRLKKKYVEKTCDTDSKFLNTTQTYCASCGVEKVIGVKPSEKFMALLGFTTTKYENLGSSTNLRGTRKEMGRPSQGGDPSDIFKMHVIQKIQAFGICASGKVDGNGNPTSGKGYGKVPSDILSLVYRGVDASRAPMIPVKEGRKIVGSETGLPYTSDELKELVKFFGLKSESDLKYLFSDDRWTYATPAERQRAFQERLSSLTYNSGENGDGLKECMKQASEFRKQDTVFNLNSVNTENQELCQMMAIECDLDIDFCTNTPKPMAKSEPGVVVPAQQESNSIYNKAKKGAQ